MISCPVVMYAPIEERERAVSERIQAITTCAEEMERHIKEIGILTHQNYSLGKRLRLVQISSFLHYYSTRLVDAYRD